VISVLTLFIVIAVSRPANKNVIKSVSVTRLGQFERQVRNIRFIRFLRVEFMNAPNWSLRGYWAACVRRSLKC